MTVEREGACFARVAAAHVLGEASVCDDQPAVIEEEVVRHPLAEFANVLAEGEALDLDLMHGEFEARSR